VARCYQHQNRGDPATAYVSHEITHHVAGAYVEGERLSAVMPWICDHVQDCITYAAACAVGDAGLIQAAEASEAASEFFRAAIQYELVAYHRANVDGLMDEDMCRFRLKAIAALRSMEVDAKGNCVQGRCSADVRETLSLKLGGNFCMMGGLVMCPDARETLEPWFAEIQAFECAAKLPVESFGVKMAQADCFTFMLEGNVVGFCDELVVLMPALYATAEALEDPQTVDMVVLTVAAWEFFACEVFLYSDKFDWDTWPLHLAPLAAKAYDYDLHHSMLKQGSQDYIAMLPLGVSALYHNGNLKHALSCLEVHSDAVRQVAREPDQAAELLTYVLFGGGNVVMTYIMLGQHQMIVDVCNETGLTWGNGGNVASHMADTLGFIRKKGDTEKALFFSSQEVLEFCFKAGYLLASKGEEVSKETVSKWLPSADQLITWMSTLETGGCALAGFFSSPLTLAAFVCEMFGWPDRALEFLDKACPDREPGAYRKPSPEECSAMAISGMEYKCTSQIHCVCLRGRVLASQGKMAEALVSFEAAISQAEFWRIDLGTALALRDMIAVTSAAASVARANKRRLGAVLRRLAAEATPAELDRFLNTAWEHVFTEKLEFSSDALMGM
jgi:hypothetical protein